MSSSSSTNPHSPTGDLPLPLQQLFSASAVRERCRIVYDYVAAQKSRWFRLRSDRLPAVVDRVVAITKRNYPDFSIPYHSRWGHFSPPGMPATRLPALQRALENFSQEERGIRQYDLAIISVLLDAGAGMQWRYRDASGATCSKSEGLALASFDAFMRGEFSAKDDDPLRVDASRLRALTPLDIRRVFQVSDQNPLVGVEGRCSLLNRLGTTVEGYPDFKGRPGALFSLVQSRREHGVPAHVAADHVLAHVLRWFTPLWPGRLSLCGVGLGDVWKHPAAATTDETSELVPFHKLSQWLTYSLLEPLEWAGVRVTNLERLTGLAEYRNGGLFIDSGVIERLSESVLTTKWKVADECIVEWRALTVTLLDQLLPLVRQALGLSADAFPLAKMLQGGTWSAGREIALSLRSDGSPPLHIESDGTVF